MSRKIDLTNPDSWDEDDVLYLFQYDTKPEAVRARAEELGVTLPPVGGPGMAKAVPDITAFSDEELQAEVERRAATTEPGDLPDQYADWKKADLVAEAKNRDLPSSGTKEELVELLEADDASVEA